mmetsp:Transcript_7370/g.26727  ORF Transcript_7370/g.26727 Transcript_7370/m.26727 type:complete len:254 (+) Transcript_7370:149-910(+)
MILQVRRYAVGHEAHPETRAPATKTVHQLLGFHPDGHGPLAPREPGLPRVAGEVFALVREVRPAKARALAKTGVRPLPGGADPELGRELLRGREGGLGGLPPVSGQRSHKRPAPRQVHHCKGLRQHGGAAAAVGLLRGPPHGLDRVRPQEPQPPGLPQKSVRFCARDRAKGLAPVRADPQDAPLAKVAKGPELGVVLGRGGGEGQGVQQAPKGAREGGALGLGNLRPRLVVVLAKVEAPVREEGHGVKGHREG